jgi:hypothetical protein
MQACILDSVVRSVHIANRRLGDTELTAVYTQGSLCVGSQFGSTDQDCRSVSVRGMKAHQKQWISSFFVDTLVSSNLQRKLDPAAARAIGSNRR